eukprot:EG_transcript_7757
MPTASIERDVRRADCLAPGDLVRGRQEAPTVQPHSYPLHTQEVLRRIQAAREDFGRQAPELGWRVVGAMWGVTPAHLDSAALRYLRLQPPALQQHVLLTLATSKVRNVKNLSAFLSQLLHDADAAPPLCLGFLAGCCPSAARCAFLHPEERAGWRQVWDRWGVTWRDFDYLVLNALYRRPAAQQEAVLWHLSDMKLRAIHNLSALLASVLRRFDASKDFFPAHPPALPLDPPDTPPRSPSTAAAPVATAPRAFPPPPASADTGSQASDTDTAGHSVGSVSSILERDPRRLSLGSCPASDEPEPDSATPSDASVPWPNPAALSPEQPGQKTQRTADVLVQLQSITAPAPASGWAVLRTLWGVGPKHFSPAALAELRVLPPLVQEHILATLAASDLQCVPDLTALLRSCVAAPAPPPTCWRFLAGLCPDADCCTFLHPALTPAWASLYRTWRMTFMNFEYAALNVLFHLTLSQQEQVLTTLTQQPLPWVSSPSAVLMRIIRGTCGSEQ